MIDALKEAHHLLTDPDETYGAEMAAKGYNGAPNLLLQADAVDASNRGRLGPKGLHGWEANHSPDRLTRPLIREGGRMREAGWDDESLYFAITVCALFNFYNRWIDATGVHALSGEAHRAGGKRSAGTGYVRK